jgi:hypothetical protein
MAVSKACAVSEVLCSIFYGHYTKSGNCSVSDEEKGRRAQATCVSYLRRRETRPCNACLISEEKGDTPMKHTSRISGMCISLLLNMHKKEYLLIILYRMLLAPTCNMLLAHIRARMCGNRHLRAWRKEHRVEHKPFDIFEAPRLSCV